MSFFKRKSMVTSFEKQIEGKTIEEIREIEMAMLKPETLPDDTMEKPTAKGIGDRCVKLYFPDQQSWDLFTKYFRVSKMVEQSCKDIDILLAALEGIDNGTLIYKKGEGIKGVSPVICEIKADMAPVLEKIGEIQKQINRCSSVTPTQGRRPRREPDAPTEVLAEKPVMFRRRRRDG